MKMILWTLHLLRVCLREKIDDASKSEKKDVFDLVFKLMEAYPDATKKYLNSHNNVLCVKNVKVKK